jgi:amino acid adenylation domain-containing protein/non-ribosomal peptide synthase protein (TIGR01720 family)
MTDLSKTIARLSPEKRQLLEKVLRRQGVDLSRSLILPQERNPNGDPLSFAQQRLWFLDRLAPGGSSYNVSQAIRLQGAIDPVALGRTFVEIVRRHEMLRTHFGIYQGEPVQIVVPPALNVLVQIDLRGLPPAQRETEMLRLAAGESRRPFDLANGPLFRALAMQLAPEEQVVFLGMHHIVSDGWSSEVLVREIVTIYTAFAAARPSPLPELPIQYADFAVWQRNWLQGEILERQLAYWREQLRGVSVLDLLTDRPRPAVQTFAGASTNVEVADGELVREIQGLARRSGATLFMATLAACQALLGRYSGQSDIALGTPISGRNQVQLEGLIGFFVNSLVVRTDLRGNPGYLELLERVRDVTLAAYAYQDVPFEKLVGHLQPERDQSRASLFQVMFGLQNATTDTGAMSGIRLEPLELSVDSAKFDLTLALQETPTGLFCGAEYNRDLFDATTVDRLLSHFKSLLLQVAADPARPLAELPLLSEVERHALLAEWNDTGAGTASFLHELVEGWATRTPDAMAVEHGDRRLTYRELDRCANQLARHLASLGVGRGVPVGLCFERSPEMVVGLLGVLKAGGGYLPLDPTYPAERLAFMAADCGLRVLLTQESLEDAIPQSWEAAVRLDADWEAIARESADPFPLALDPGDLAYVIYTSGSTGRPKGVMVSHRGLGNLAREQARVFHVGPGSQVLQFASLSFDASIWEIAMGLGSGATLHLADREALLPGPDLLGLLRERRISAVTLPPSALAGLPPAALPDLRTIIVASEACPLEVAQRWSAGRRLVNAYGPTEATVCATYADFHGDFDRLPIGRPITGAQVHILEPGLHPVPIGVKGELYLGGVGLARGYWKRPDLTAVTFLPDPFSSEPGSRLYRTGDLGRLLADGEIELFGRVDSQIKLRGYRIELGEIEAALGRHPAVREAAVLLREDHPGERRIVAYVVPQRAEVTAEELRSSLGVQLPAYMIPAFFVLLEAMPRLPNDKVDRHALPVPESRAAAAAEDVAPRNHAEEVLAAIWKHVLRLETVGVHQNFFEIGGDSILGVQVISRAGQEGLHLTPRQLFSHPTIAGLAEVAEQVDGSDAAAVGPVVGPVPLMPIQHWFFEQRLPHPEHFNQSILFATGLRVEPALLARAVEILLLHHDALRIRFEPPAESGALWRQRNEAPGAPAPVVHVDLSGVPLELVSPAIEAFAAQLQASLSLELGPLLRVALFTAAEGPERLFLVVHHLVVDGVSWRVLLEDLETVYSQLSRGEQPVLPGKTTSFQSWAERIGELARSPAFTVEADYWLKRGSLEAPSLPCDHCTGENTVASAKFVVSTLTAEETKALLQEVPKAYRTQINDILLTALAEALAPWVGRRRVLLDLEGHGREEIAADVDASRTIGYFAALFPVLVDLEGTASPGEALKSVKEQMRGIPGRGFGYGLLRYLGTDEVRDPLASLPHAGLIFNYFGQLDQVVAGSSLFRPAQESAGPERHPLQTRPYLLEVSASVRAGRLSTFWIYSENRHERSTIEALGGRFVAALRRLIDHCLSPQAGGYTPSDFPLARLDQPRLDRLVDAAGGRLEDLYPLSPMQEGMLFQTLQAADSGVYINQLTLDLEIGDVALFKRAWSQVLARHAVLRTGFQWQGLETPLQAVLPRAEIPWDDQDWRNLPEGEWQARLAAYLTEDRARGFDVSTPPLLRAALIRLGEESYRMILTSHHLICDGWAWSILWGELFAIYEAGLRGEEAVLSRVSAFREYIAWLRAQDTAAAESFWRRRLAGFGSPTTFAVAASEPPSSGRPFGEAQGWLPADVLDALRSFARSRQVTLNTLIQGAWSVLLSRYSGEEDVLFGVVTAGRSASVPGIESMVGLFINTLPLRAQVAGGSELDKWLLELQERQSEAHQYEYSRLTDIQGWSEVPRGAPLFESILVFENYPVDAALHEQAGQRLRIGRGMLVEQVNYPVCIEVVPVAQLTLQALYDRRRFDSATITRLLGHLRTLLAVMVHGTIERLERLPLLSPEERHQLLMEAQGGPARSRTGGGLESWVEAWARSRPEVPAVAFGETVLGYRELNARANQLARKLRGLGVGLDSPVGIALERGPEMVTAVLAVLKAGGAYVPLDPTYPKERLALMRRDALGKTGAPVVLTQERWARLFQEEGQDRSSPLRIVCLDAERDDLATQSDSDLGVSIDPDNLAYVIYTSGSTGQPKGVALTRRALENLLAWQEDEGHLAGPARTLQFASLSFDVSFQEIFSTWRAGGTLYLIEEERRRDSAALLDLLEKSGIERLFLPFVALRHLAEAAEARGGTPPLRDIVTAGEQLQVTPAIVRWLGRLPGCRLHNHYGPSETHVVTAATLDGNPAGWPALPSIGRPVAGTVIHLLDRDLGLVPPGVPGELYIGGVALARGYLHRPDLTALRFVPDPFGALRGEPGARLYRTGDLARWSPTQDIEYLGRTDQQVKVRGFRVEPGEVEAVLSRHPAVHEAVVDARPEPGTGGMRLVAYLVPAEGRALVPVEVRDALRNELPEYMVPSAFVVLEAMPLTPSGKLNRRALPDPVQTAAESGAPGGDPIDPITELMTSIWSDVLGRDRVSVRADFFELGGHSLLAMQVIARVRSLLGIEVSLQTLFEHPTLARFADAVRREGREGAGPAALPIVRIDRTGDLPLSFAQQRLWFIHHLDTASPAYNIPLACRLEGRLHVPVLSASLDEIVRRHEVLRTTFRDRGEEAVQMIAPPLPVPLPVIDLGGLCAPARLAESSRLMRQEGGRPFDLIRGPLFRIQLLRLGEEEHVALLTMHHIVSDGWSMGVLMRELRTLYAAFSLRMPSPLPELAIQYADYAAWQRQWLSGEVLEAELGYWRERLGDRPPVLELPTDRPRPAMQTFAGALQPVWLEGEVLAGLRARARQEGATLFMVLLAAFEVLLQRYSGQDDFLVGTPIAGRNRLELEGLIGFFVNMLVLRADLGGEAGPGLELAGFLGRVRETTLSAFAHQDLPFEKLVLELQPERSLSRTPLFQVLFVLQNTPAGELSSPDGLTFAPLAVESTTAKFDLTLTLVEAGSGLAGTIEYKRDLFDSSMVRRMAQHLTNLLQGLSGAFAGRVSELPLLSAGERQQALAEWSRSREPVSASEPFHRLFEAQAARTPEAPAVIFGNRALTYEELDRHANRLARWLCRNGVGPDVPVGIFLERSLSAVVGLLGILKAGGAYLPLDPTYPAERLAFMVADCGVRGILTQETLAQTLLPGGQGFTLLLDGAWETVAREQAEPCGVMVAPGDLAYMIYTSGSTGSPKGVMVSHRGLGNLALAQARRFQVGPGSQVLQFASLSFDASISEIAMALCCGATLHLASREELLPGPDLLRLLQERRITTVTLPPAVLPGLSAEDLPALQTVIVAGESCDPVVARRWALGRRLINAYGPTEATVCVTAADFEEELARLPIGRPIAGMEIYVLDRDLSPVPVGIPGEIWVGGIGLARGYRGRPDLTAAAFVPHPFSEEAGARLYRTGDLGLYLRDGSVVFLGRADSQVKLRGFRIELGEIEAVLGRHPGVREVAVLVREDQPGDRRLTAYVVAAGEPPASDELRRFLLEKLPQHMLPAAFVPLDALPLTPNGKIDRRALPSPGRQGDELVELTPARDALELALIGVWQEVLDTQPIGIHESFFELGGHSLLALRLTVLLRDRFQWEVPLATLFQEGTVAGLANVLRGEARAAVTSSLVTLRAAGDPPALYFTPPAGGGLQGYQRLIQHLDSRHPVHGFQARGLHTDDEPSTSMEEMADTYVASLRQFQPRGPYHLGGMSMGALVAFEMARKLRAQGDEVALLVLIDPSEPNLVLPDQLGEPDDVMILATFGMEAGLDIQPEQLRPLGDEDRLACLVGRAVEAGIVPAGAGLTAGVEFLRRTLRVFKAGGRAAQQYLPGPYSGRVTILRATEMPDGAPQPQDGGDWNRLCSEPLAIYPISGHHFSILKEPNVRIVADLLRRLLQGEL